VSVVATGIEQAQIARNQATQAIATTATATTTAAATSSPDNRLAELTARLRADNARLAERAQKLEPAPATQAIAPAPAQAHAAPAQRPSSNVERAALAAIAAAVETPQQAPIQPASYGDVTVRPIAQKPPLFPDHNEAARVEPEPAT